MWCQALPFPLKNKARLKTMHLNGPKVFLYFLFEFCPLSMGIGISVLWVKRLACRSNKNINLFGWFPKSFPSQWKKYPGHKHSCRIKFKLPCIYEHLNKFLSNTAKAGIIIRISFCYFGKKKEKKAFSFKPGEAPFLLLQLLSASLQSDTL